MVLRWRDGPADLRLKDGLITLRAQGDRAELRAGRAVRPARLRGEALEMTVPFAPDFAGVLTLDGTDHEITLPRWRLALAQAAVLPGFVWAGFRAVPGAWRWFREQDPAARIEVRGLFGLDPVTTAIGIQGDVFGTPKAGQGPVTIVLPVYNAFDMLPEVLARVEANTDLPWHLIAVEDASPDPAVRPWLRGWAEGRANVTLLENAENLGFIGAVNRGLEAAGAQDGPVILLNSDAFVPKAWASRLIGPLADPGVASVTPMSNDAELMSVPVISQRMDLAAGQGEAIDAVARTLAPAALEADMPTGVGFCMALSRDWLARVGALDPAFGRGYGEEVDWCQRAEAMGARHVAQPGLFVEHRGGASFGSAEKARLLAQNAALLRQRYPGFDGAVQDWIGADPLLGQRMALALAWAGTQGRIRVYVAHDMGGGAEIDLARRIAADGVAVVLRVGGAYRWQLEVHGPTGVLRAGTEDAALVRRLVGLLPAREIIYACAVGDPDPITLPPFLLELAEGQGLRVLMHDYFPLSPAYTLLGADGAYTGLPRPGAEDRSHQVRRPDGTRVPLSDWQAAWGALLARADEVEVFSEASAALVRAAYPKVSTVKVRPHALPVPVPRVERPAGPEVIGILGNMNAHKGAAVLQALARSMPKGRVVLLGQMAPGWRVRGLREHGPYQVEEIPDLVARYGITRWFIPSIWPETFSFTTHEALATGLPVFAFDLGAQGDAVRTHVASGGQGGVIPLGADIDSVVQALLERPKDPKADT